jgi:hypothetical protein
MLVFIVCTFGYFVQMGLSSWQWIPPDVACETMERLKWEREVSAVFRRVCKGWRDAHDQCMRHLSVRPGWLNSAHLRRYILRFVQRVKEKDMCGDTLDPSIDAIRL